MDADRKGKLSLSVRKRPEALVNERFRPFLEQGMRESKSIENTRKPSKIKGFHKPQGVTSGSLRNYTKLQK